MQIVNNMSEPFGLPITSDQYTSPMQEILADYYETAYPTMNALLDKAYAAAIYGKETEQWFNRINDIHYLGILLFIIFKRRHEYYEKTGNTQTNCEIYETYRLDCIRKTFQCKGIDIIPLLETLNLQPGICSEETGDCPPSENGIGNMHIESAPTCHHKFIIH